MCEEKGCIKYRFTGRWKIYLDYPFTKIHYGVQSMYGHQTYIVEGTPDIAMLFFAVMTANFISLS